MKVIICGAGIAGLAAARFLAVAGWEVLIVEKAASRRKGGYMIDFAGSGYDALERAGLIDELRRRDHTIGEVKYVRENGRTRSQIDYQLFKASLNDRLLSVLRGDVEAVLFEALPDGVEVRFDTKVTEVINFENDAKVRLSSGEVETADLVIGADGIHSELREMVFGPEKQFSRYLGYHTAAFIFEDAGLAQKLAGGVEMLTVPHRQIGIYAIGADAVATFFVNTAADAIRPDDAATELRRVYGDLGWHMPAILDAADQTEDIYYDWLAQIEMPNLSKGRVVMLGDAGYAVSLLAGQGASLAIAGAWMLTKHIGAGNVAEGLVAFNAELRDDVLKKQAAGRKTAKWFVPPSHARNVVRDVFLNLTRLPGLAFILRRFFAPSLKSIVKD